MAHTVAVGEFEGPLGILLELVEHGKLEVTAISVAEITSRYLERIKKLTSTTPEELSEFVQLGARLLYIKSLALLPQATPDEQLQELSQLNLELAEYRRFTLAAKMLAQRSGQRLWERGEVTRLQASDIALPTIGLQTLANAFARALERATPALETQVVRGAQISLETVVARLKQRLAKGSYELTELLDNCRDRLEIVVTFLAVLELLRSGSVRVTQSGHFKPIRVEAIGA